MYIVVTYLLYKMQRVDFKLKIIQKKKLNNSNIDELFKSVVIKKIKSKPKDYRPLLSEFLQNTPSCSRNMSS